MEHVLDAKANTKRSQQMPNLAPYTQLSPVSSMQPEQSGFPPSFHNSEQIVQSQSSFPQAPPLQSQPAAAPANLTPEHAQPPESSRQANDKGTNRALHSHPLQRLDFSLEEGQTSDAEDDLPAAMEMSTAASGALLLSPDGPASGSSTTEGSLARVTSSSGFGSRVMPVVKTPIKLVKGAVQSFRSLPARTPPEALMPSQPVGASHLPGTVLYRAASACAWVSASPELRIPCFPVRCTLRVYINVLQSLNCDDCRMSRRSTTACKNIVLSPSLLLGAPPTPPAAWQAVQDLHLHLSPLPWDLMLATKQVELMKTSGSVLRCHHWSMSTPLLAGGPA